MLRKRTVYSRMQKLPSRGSVLAVLKFFVDEAWLILKGNVNSQNNRYRCSKSVHPLHVFSIVWPYDSSKLCHGDMLIQGPIIFEATPNGLWPHRSADLNPCDYCLREALQDRVYVNIPHSLLELKG